MAFNDWREYSVQQLVDLEMLSKPLDGNHGDIHPKVNDYVSEGVPFIMANDLKNGRIDYDNCAFITEDQAKILKKGLAKPGDILITHKGTIGRTAIVTDEYESIMLTPQVTYYRVLNGISNKYLKYYFDSIEFQKTIKNWAGDGGTRPYIGITAQRKLPIVLPNVVIQNKIAEFLTVFDEKIDINNKINKIVERQGQVIFNNEFINNLEASKSWEEKSLIDIANYLNGLAMQKFRPVKNEGSIPVLKIKELRQGECDLNSDLCSENIKADYIVDDGDVIFSWSGSLLVDFWCGGKCGLNQHLFKISSDKYDKWFYYFWTKHHLREFISIAEDKATTMGHIKRDHLKDAKVLIPPKEDYNRIGEVLKPICELIIFNRIENRKLAELRDTLLHKLMTGDIDLENVAF